MDFFHIHYPFLIVGSTRGTSPVARHMILPNSLDLQRIQAAQQQQQPGQHHVEQQLQVGFDHR